MNNNRSGFAAVFLVALVALLFGGGIYLVSRGRLGESGEALTASIGSSLASHFKDKSPAIRPGEVMYFNPAKNSGWIYIAQTEPYRGKLFWVAAVRSLSTEQTDTSAQLMYGITDVATKKHYSGFIDGGSLSEDPGKINITFSKAGKELFRFKQTGSDHRRLSLMVDLPYEKQNYKLTQSLSAGSRPLYEGGDGIIPMSPGVDSLYVSLIPTEKYWIDFQKFDLASLSLAPKSPNHRWMSFKLDKKVGVLPAGTAGVGWEILGSGNERRPGYTNIDLLVPGYPQLTANETQIGSLEIDELQTWRGKGKEYLKKWKVSYPGVSLVFETVVPDQENSVLGTYFYEGAINVIDPATGKKVGSGMLEETHDESSGGQPTIPGGQ